MIVTRIIGGLGNQMFQYALGRRLSLEHGVPLKLDTLGFETYELRTLGLGHLMLEFEIATPDEVRELTGVAPRFPENIVSRKRLPRFLRRSRRFHPRHRRELAGFHFDPTVLSTPTPVYLDGYWQTARYFDAIADQIRADFAVRTPLAARDAEVAALIAESEAVSLHVRRGDYASNPRALALHGLCSLEYYAAAVAHLAERLERPRYFVFSDDPTWAAEHLKLPGGAVFVDHNDGARSHEDLRLMSRCRHHVIANSSFSWWGAWLNASPDKIVVAPRRWLADPSRAYPDVCPADWVRI